MQLYNKDEIMIVYVKDIAVKASIEMFQNIGISFAETVEKISEKFSFSKTRAEHAVDEYWK